MLKIVSSHIATNAAPVVGRLSSFDLGQDIAGRCFELLLIDNPILEEI